MSDDALKALREAVAKQRTPEEKLADRSDSWALELEAREVGRKKFKAKTEPPVRFPEILTLAERLARPHEKPSWRIENFQLRGQYVVCAAQFKAGKTELRDNRIRALVDGVPFLGEFTTVSLQGRAVILDFEMPGNLVDSWLEAKGIKNQEKVVPIPLRGLASSFNLFDEELFAFWAKTLRELEAEDLTLDCLRPVLDALGLDENHEAGKFFVKFTELLTAAGVSEAFAVHHMGHEGTRSRGDSRILDWPDVTWNLKKGTSRYISAEGRDVLVGERKLEFDPETRLLTVTPGVIVSQKAERRQDLVDLVVTAIEEAEARGNLLGQEAIVAKRPEWASKQEARDALLLAESEELVYWEAGPRGAHRYKRRRRT